MSDFRIVETIDIWRVVSNTDLTEGRGKSVLLNNCRCKATAKRLAKGKGVMGTDALVRKALGFKLYGDHFYYAPSYLVQPSRDDIEAQRIMDQREEAVRKAKEAGLTELDIELIRNSKP